MLSVGRQHGGDNKGKATVNVNISCNFAASKSRSMENSKNEILVPSELIEVLKDDNQASDFFYSLSAGYKRGYCDWVGGAKNELTRQSRAEKALLMLQNKQKTLKTV